MFQDVYKSENVMENKKRINIGGSMNSPAKKEFRGETNEE